MRLKNDEKEIYFCVNINENFKHHRKLKVGEKYLVSKTSHTVSVYSMDNIYIGFYWLSMFISLSEKRNEILNDLGI